MLDAVEGDFALVGFDADLAARDLIGVDDFVECDVIAAGQAMGMERPGLGKCRRGQQQHHEQPTHENFLLVALENVRKRR